MAFRQTYKGVFQFKDQETLERAMAENQAEALGADAMGLQDSFHGNGVMFLNINAKAEEQDWDEMAVAIATLAMHASKGFAYAYADRASGPQADYYEASGGGSTPTPSNSETTLALNEDYFPMRANSRFVFQSNKDAEKVFNWTTLQYDAQGRSYFFFQDDGHRNIHFNDYWDGTFYYKDNALIGTVAVGTETELDELPLTDPYASQIIYNSQGQPGDMLYSIWNQSDVLVILNQQGFEDISVPYGNLKDCMVIRVEMYKIVNDELDVHVHTQYFCKGIGLVKWETADEALELVEMNLKQQ